MKFKISLIILMIFIFYFYGVSQSTPQLKNEDEYLKDLNKSASDFKNEEEKLLYFIENLENSDYTFQIANQISEMKNKSPELKNALKKKIITSFLRIEDLDFSRITSGIFKGSSNLIEEYLPFLLEVVKEDSPYRKRTFIESLPTYEKEKENSLFTLEEKLQIIAYKEILRIDPEHIAAFNFFINYPREKPSKSYSFLFQVSENKWSGKGLMNENGEWILPPIYDFPSYQKLVNEGMILVDFARSFYPTSKLVKIDSKIYSYGNWIDSSGTFLMDKAIPNASKFNGGVAKCFGSKSPKYINTKGEFVDSLSGVNTTIFKNKYTVTNEKDNTLIRDEQNNIITTLDKKYFNISYNLEDNLFTYCRSGKYHQERFYGYIDLQGNILTSADFYTSIDYNFSVKNFEGREVMALPKESQKYGLVNRKFETIIPFTYEELKVINDKYIIGKKADEYFLFNIKGELLDQVPEFFKSSRLYYRDDIGFSYVDNRLHLINLEGDEIPFFKDYEAVDYKFDKAILKKDSKFGIIDIEDNEVLPFKYDDIHLLNQNTAIVKTGDRYKSIDLTNKTETSFPAGYVLKKNKLPFNSKYILFEFNGYVGLVNPKNEIIIPFRFEKISLSTKSLL